jgi:Fe-S cluster assembly ATP-binding protein
LPGVSTSTFLHASVNAIRKAQKMPALNETAFRQLLEEKMALLSFNPALAERDLNTGFSGGEQKRNEILQMAVLDPRLAILDETDSGLDIDAMKIVARGVNAIMTPEKGLILITHYQRLLHYIKPTVVHVMMKGRIVMSGGSELALKLEEKGYDWLQSHEASHAR